MTDIQFTSNSSKASIWQQHLIQWQSSGWSIPPVVRVLQ